MTPKTISGHYVEYPCGARHPIKDRKTLKYLREYGFGEFIAVIVESRQGQGTPPTDPKTGKWADCVEKCPLVMEVWETKPRFVLSGMKINDAGIAGHDTIVRCVGEIKKKGKEE